MRLGIVGHAAEKFHEPTEKLAREAIHRVIDDCMPELVISGRSPMGGVDIWAEEIARERMIPFQPYEPAVRQWDPPGRYGYKARNLDIARNSDLVVCVVVSALPPGYSGMQFKGCYHCRGRNPDHIKSGGCWTAWKAPAQHWVIVAEVAS